MGTGAISLCVFKLSLLKGQSPAADGTLDARRDLVGRKSFQ